MNNDYLNDLSLPDDDDIYYPGQLDAERNESLADIHAEISKMQDESERESKGNLHRFIISTFISVLALCASIVAAVAAIIPLI